MTFLYIVMAIVLFVVLLSVFKALGARSAKKGEEKQDDAFAEDGSHEDQFSRGSYYITKNLKKAKYWFEKAEKQGSVKAKIGLRLLEEAQKDNFTSIEADKWEDALLEESDDHEALFKRGAHYITQNIEKAKYWFEKAEKHGSSSAKIGLRLTEDAKKKNRLSVETDLWEDSLLEESVDKEALFNRGKYYITKNIEKAEYWFKKAEQHGSSDAKVGLRLVEEAKKNNSTSVDNEMWEGALEEERGDYEALFNRGKRYLFKNFDPNKAKYWFDKADEHGFFNGKLGRWLALDALRFKCSRIDNGDKGEKLLSNLGYSGNHFSRGNALYKGYLRLQEDDGVIYLIDEPNGFFWNDEKRMELAEERFRSAIMEGDRRGVEWLYNIAMRYVSGVGGYSPNKERACKLLEEAASYGYAPAKEARLKIERGEL